MSEDIDWQYEFECCSERYRGLKEDYDWLKQRWDEAIKDTLELASEADKLANALEHILFLKKDGLLAGLVDEIASKALAENKKYEPS